MSSNQWQITDWTGFTPLNSFAGKTLQGCNTVRGFLPEEAGNLSF